MVSQRFQAAITAAQVAGKPSESNTSSCETFTRASGTPADFNLFSSVQGSASSFSGMDQWGETHLDSLHSIG